MHGADLGAHVLKTLVERNGIPDDEYDDVMFGCVDTIGPLAGDIARTCWLAAGLSDAVPGTTIDRQCGSSQQAVHFAAQAIMSGVNDVVIAGGVQTMTQIPISSAMIAAQPMGFSDPFSGSQGWVARYGSIPPSQFASAQMIADKWKISRVQMEEFALRSHTLALTAIKEGRFDREIAPLNGVAMDETPRNTSMEKMAELEPLMQGGTITAAVSSQTCDGSSAMLIVSEAALKRYKLTPRARIVHMSVRAADPIRRAQAGDDEARRKRIRDRFVYVRFDGALKGIADFGLPAKVIKAARLYFEDSRGDRADELLALALKHQPEEHAYWLARLEIRFLLGDSASFVEIAEAFMRVAPDAAEWDEIKRLGVRIAPDSPLFAGHASNAADSYGPWPTMPNWIQSSWDLTAEVIASEFHHHMRDRIQEMRERFAHNAAPATL